MKKALLLLPLLPILLVLSCKKKPTEPEVVPHLRGRLVEHCNTMKPMANYNLYVTQKNESNMNVRVVGVDTTDAEGYFDIACPGLLETPVQIEHRINETNSTVLYFDIPLNSFVRKVGNDYDFATIYYRASWGSNVRVEIANDHPLTDSLYLGYPLSPIILHPMKKGVQTVYIGFDKLSAARSDTAYSKSMLRFYWGIGEKDYDSAKNYSVTHRKDEPQYNLITTTSYPCAPSNTSLFIP